MPEHVCRYVTRITRRHAPFTRVSSLVSKSNALRKSLKLPRRGAWDGGFYACWVEDGICRRSPLPPTRSASELGMSLDQPSLPTHAVELASLWDEVRGGVHLRDVAFVHDDHPVRGGGRTTTTKVRFCWGFNFTHKQLLWRRCLGRVSDILKMSL